MYLAVPLVCVRYFAIAVKHSLYWYLVQALVPRRTCCYMFVSWMLDCWFMQPFCVFTLRLWSAFDMVARTPEKRVRRSSPSSSLSRTSSSPHSHPSPRPPPHHHHHHDHHPLLQHFDYARSHKMLATGLGSGIFLFNFPTKWLLWNVQTFLRCARTRLAKRCRPKKF